MNAKSSLLKTVAARLTLADCAGRDTVTVVQAGQILGISKDASYEAVKRGEIPVIRIGARYVVPLAQLRRMIEGEVLSQPVRLQVQGRHTGPLADRA